MPIEESFQNMSDSLEQDWEGTGGEGAGRQGQPVGDSSELLKAE